MSVVAVVAVARDDAGVGQGLTAAPFVDALVARLPDEYGVDRDELRSEADAALATFASARVRAFVPILVEKRVRTACRGQWSARP
jgi:acetyl/propionyl-CoA carboxylase alpha subunit